MAQEVPSAEKDALRQIVALLDEETEPDLGAYEHLAQRVYNIARQGLDGSVIPAAECQHDPRYSREECGLCGGQVSWCDRCGVALCGCPIPVGDGA